ncbi:hypothetical protein MCAP1_000293 [Malassezia caprae]|uniref:Pali-domain-containing protein n=1 Tax=Malassezia caprae TaxID=1381934 RepID=A0AAF0ITU8_9BASI|nr:hypothetical protein MCAP1_000293 [Malassezia caprae]
MRLFSAAGLLAAVAAGVLLGIATFGVPINHKYYLLELGFGQSDFHFGPFGYTHDGHASATKLGYDMPYGLDGKNPISSLVHTLSYVLVVYPIAFAFAVVAAFSSLFAVTCKTMMNAVAIFFATIGAIIATLAFAIVIAIYFELKDVFSDINIDLKFGQSFYFTVVGAACLFFASMLMAGGLCCDPMFARHRRSSPTASYSAAPTNAPPTEYHATQMDLPAFPEYHPTQHENVYEMDDTMDSMAKPSAMQRYDYGHPGAAASAEPYLVAQPTESRTHLLTEAPYLPSRPSVSSQMPTEHAYIDAPEAPPSMAPPPLSAQQADAWFLHSGSSAPTAAPPMYPPALAGPSYANEKR